MKWTNDPVSPKGRRLCDLAEDLRAETPEDVLSMSADDVLALTERLAPLIGAAMTVQRLGEALTAGETGVER